MTNPQPAPYPPGEFLREEIEARGLSPADLAKILGRSPAEVEALIAAEIPLTAEWSVDLAAALGASATFWLNMEASYRLELAGPADPAIAARARELMPAGEASAAATHLATSDQLRL